MALLNPGGAIAQFQRNDCSIPPVEVIWRGGVRITHFITGMALGVDMYAAEIVLDLKSKYPHITLESAIPCETQAIKWSVASRERYYNIAAKCDKETMLQREYTPDCMDKRNRYMVDHADYILAVWNGCPSGTGNTVRYAHKKGKSIIVINPVSIDVTQE